MRMKPIAIFAALMLLFGIASAEVTANQPDDPALATVNGEDITKSQVDELIPTFVSYEFITDATDYRTVLDYLVQQKILTKKIEELGFDQFTAEEESAFSQEAQAQWDEALKEYAEYNRAEDTQEALEAALAQAEAYYAGQGMTLDKLVKHARTTASMNRLSQYLTGDNEPTEEEIQAMFEQFGPAYEQEYKDDIAKYEYMTQYAGQTSWYTPPGFRGVIHILLDAEDALLSNYNTLQKTFELQQEKTDAELIDAEPVEEAESQELIDQAETAETVPTEPVTQEMVTQARDAVLQSRQEDIKMIYDRLARGEDFTALVREYGEDPGMTDETTLNEGYPVHRDSVMYDPAFTSAAFSEKMQQPGDVSDPAVSSFGIHILKYLRDVPSGLIMTDAIHDELQEYLMSVKENEAFSAALDLWKEENTIVYHQDTIDQVISDALSQTVPEGPEDSVMAVDGMEEETQTPENGN